MNWIFDNDWLKLFNEKKHDLSGVSNFLNDYNFDLLSEKERLKIRMLSFADFYFDSEDVSKGKSMLNQLSYRPDITQSIEKTWQIEVNIKKILEDVKIPILSLTSASDMITVNEYYREHGFSSGKESFSNESGFGLGLSHAFQTARNYNGRIEVFSKVQVGTMVNMFLPKVIVQKQSFEFNDFGSCS